jgi:hypothetical protein
MKNERTHTWLLVWLATWLAAVGIAEDLARRPSVPPDSSGGVHLAHRGR